MAFAFRCSDSKSGFCDIKTCLNSNTCLQEPNNKNAFLNHIKKITQLEKDNKTLNDNISECYNGLYRDEMTLTSTERWLDIEDLNSKEKSWHIRE